MGIPHPIIKLYMFSPDNLLFFFANTAKYIGSWSLIGRLGLPSYWLLITKLEHAGAITITRGLLATLFVKVVISAFTLTFSAHS